MHPRQSGFTLVELAIVMVVVALLFGAVMKAHNMIDQSRVKQTVRKIDELHAATLTYLDHFNALPGDDGNSHNGLITPATISPDDGRIDDINAFWRQLHESGIIAGEGSNPLMTPWGTPYYAGYGLAGWSGSNVVCAKLVEAIARQIDEHYDDGKGQSGAIRIAPDAGGKPASTATAFTGSLPAIWLCSRNINPSLLGK